DRFIEKVDSATRAGKLYRIIGIFQKPPRKRCTCAGEKSWTERQRSNTVKRHKKLGFWYCSECKRVRGGAQSPKNLRQAEGEYGPYLRFDDDQKLIPNYPFTEAYSK